MAKKISIDSEFPTLPVGAVLLDEVGEQKQVKVAPTGKKKIGRPKGSKNKTRPYVVAPTVDAPSDDDFQLFEQNKESFTEFISVNSLKYLFEIVALFLGSHWELNNKEASDLQKALARIAEKLPKSKNSKLKKLIDEYAPFVQLAITAGAIVWPRYVLTNELKKLEGTNGNAFATISVDEATEAFNRNAGTTETKGVNNEGNGADSSRDGTSFGSTNDFSKWFEEYGNNEAN